MYYNSTVYAILYAIPTPKALPKLLTPGSHLDYIHHDGIGATANCQYIHLIYLHQRHWQSSWHQQTIQTICTKVYLCNTFASIRSAYTSKPFRLSTPHQHSNNFCYLYFHLVCLHHRHWQSSWHQQTTHTIDNNVAPYNTYGSLCSTDTGKAVGTSKPLWPSTPHKHSNIFRYHFVHFGYLHHRHWQSSWDLQTIQTISTKVGFICSTDT